MTRAAVAGRKAARIPQCSCGHCHPSLPADNAHLAVSDLSQLRGHTFGTIYADPPWRYGNQSTRGATDDHYVTMSVDDICALPVADLADTPSHLHLWTTNAFIEAALTRVLPAWGFVFKSMLVWTKPQMGMGNYWRVSHELLLLGVRGSKTFSVKNEKSWVNLPRGRHSEKPDAIRKKIQRVSPGPYLELFGRCVSPGWTVWGNQIPHDLFNPTGREAAGCRRRSETT